MKRLSNKVLFIALLAIVIFSFISCGSPQAEPISEATAVPTATIEPAETESPAEEKAAADTADPEPEETETPEIGELGIPVVTGDMRVHYIDVGQGDATFIELPTGETMLIDAGETGKDVVSYIESLGYDTIDMLFATHPHADHIGGMADVINAFQIGEIYMPNVTHTTKTFENMLDAIDQNGYAITTIENHFDLIRFHDGLEISTLSPGDKEYEDLNDYSIVVTMTYGKTRFLFMGDATELIEDEIIVTAHNVLKVGHHGSNTSTSQNFVDDVFDFSDNEEYNFNSTTKAAIISCGQDNDYGHPHTEVIERLSGAGADIYMTYELGTIIVTSDKENISVDKDANIGVDSVLGAVAADPEPEAAASVESEETQSSTGQYVGSKNSDKYHKPSCRWAGEILPKNEIWFTSAADAQSQGYVACKVCGG